LAAFFLKLFKLNFNNKKNLFIGSPQKNFLFCDNDLVPNMNLKSMIIRISCFLLLMLCSVNLIAQSNINTIWADNDDDEGEDAKAKRYDTRVILVADSSSTGGSQSLWANNDIEDRHEGIIFPHFNQLHLAVSESNGFSGDNLTNETLEKSGDNSNLRTLKELTDTKNPISADNSDETDNSERVNIPILSSFIDLKYKEPSRLINKIRRRQLSLKQIKDKRFALRIE
jgi:hypothetical protein